MKKKSRTANIFWRIVITTTGFALIIIAICNLTLGIFGETTTGSVSTRRMGGRIDGSPVNISYKWSIDYSYSVDGKLYSGSNTYRGSDMSVDYDTMVYYFTFAPWISSLDASPVPNLGTAVYIGLGIFLIYVMNSKPKKRKLAKKKVHATAKAAIKSEPSAQHGENSE